MGCNTSLHIKPENTVTIYNEQYYDLLKNIRNGLRLKDSEIKYINQLPNENLIDIIIIYNDMIQFYQEIL